MPCACPDCPQGGKGFGPACRSPRPQPPNAASFGDGGEKGRSWVTGGGQYPRGSERGAHQCGGSRDRPWHAWHVRGTGIYSFALFFPFETKLCPLSSPPLSPRHARCRRRFPRQEQTPPWRVLLRRHRTTPGAAPMDAHTPRLPGHRYQQDAPPTQPQSGRHRLKPKCTNRVCSGPDSKTFICRRPPPSWLRRRRDSAPFGEAVRQEPAGGDQHLRFVYPPSKIRTRQVPPVPARRRRFHGETPAGRSAREHGGTGLRLPSALQGSLPAPRPAQPPDHRGQREASWSVLGARCPPCPSPTCQRVPQVPVPPSPRLPSFSGRHGLSAGFTAELYLGVTSGQLQSDVPVSARWAAGGHRGVFPRTL